MWQNILYLILMHYNNHCDRGTVNHTGVNFTMHHSSSNVVARSEFHNMMK